MNKLADQSLAIARQKESVQYRVRLYAIEFCAR
jgi:hypothetical protein